MRFNRPLEALGLERSCMEYEQKEPENKESAINETVNCVYSGMHRAVHVSMLIYTGRHTAAEFVVKLPKRGCAELADLLVANIYEQDQVVNWVQVESVLDRRLCA